MEKTDLIRGIIEQQRKIDRFRRDQQIDIWMSLPLSIAQLKSLFFISNHGSTNLGNLAAALKVTPTNTTGIVERLVKKGLVSRTENQQDRRMLSLEVTEQGRELVDKLRQRRISRMSKVLEKMSPEELTNLNLAYANLARAIEDAEK